MNIIQLFNFFFGVLRMVSRSGCFDKVGFSKFTLSIWSFDINSELGSWNSTSSFVGSTLVSTSVDLEHSTCKPSSSIHQANLVRCNPPLKHIVVGRDVSRLSSVRSCNFQGSQSMFTVRLIIVGRKRKINCKTPPRSGIIQKKSWNT